MFIIPIGTRSSLAFKPKLTIGLIVLNIVIAVISFISAGHDESALFSVHRKKFARQAYLYAIEKGRDPGDITIEKSVSQIENADDYYELETAVIELVYGVDGGVKDFQDFEERLSNRSTDFYSDISVTATYSYEEWEKHRDREARILAGNINYSFGLIPSRMGRYYTFITHLFLHGGLMHLIGNMLFLWVVGCLLEDSWGRAPFLVFYLAGGAFAGLAHCLQDTSSAVPLIGASGAIAAAMGAFTVIHFKTRIKFFYFFLFFFRPYIGTFFLPAFVFLPLWFIQQVALKYLSDFAGGSNVAYVAHIAGYMMGVLTALALKFTGFEENILSSRVRKRQIDAGILKDPRFNEAHELMKKGISSRAAQIFGSLISERPHDTQMLQDISMIYMENGLDEKFRETSEKALKALLMSSQNEAAANWASQMISGDGCTQQSYLLLLRVAKWLDGSQREHEAYDIYDYVRKGAESPQVFLKSSFALAKTAGEKMNDPAHALSILEEIIAKTDDPDWLDRIRGLEAALGSPGKEVPAV